MYHFLLKFTLEVGWEEGKERGREGRRKGESEGGIGRERDRRREGGLGMCHLQ